MPLSTVSAILTRLGMGRLGRLGLEQPLRYERSRPGELVHIDVKKLGRIKGGAGKRIGGEGHSPYNPQRTDAAGKRRATRSAGSTSTSPSTTTAASPTPRSSPTRKQQPRSASSAALSPSTAATASPVERLLTDNGSAYRATIHALACRRLGIRHLRTRPYRPQTNGKAERFIRTLLAGWAYGAIYRSSTRTHHSP